MVTMTSSTPAQVSLRSLRAKVRKAHDANESAQVAARTARILSALPAYLAVMGGRVGGVEWADESPTWDSKAEFARDLGTSASNLTGLVRLGHALHLGLQPDGAHRDEWAVLSNKVNNSPTIRTTLDNPSATLADVLKAVEVGKAEKGGRQVTTTPGDGDSGTSGAGGDESGQAGSRKAPTQRDMLDTLKAVLFAGDLTDETTAVKVVKAAHDVLAVAFAALGDDTYATAVNRHKRILKAEDKRRADESEAVAS